MSVCLMHTDMYVCMYHSMPVALFPTIDIKHTTSCDVKSTPNPFQCVRWLWLLQWRGGVLLQFLNHTFHILYQVILVLINVIVFQLPIGLLFFPLCISTANWHVVLPFMYFKCQLACCSSLYVFQMPIGMLFFPLNFSVKL
jgi:hypothetical protein